MNLVLKSCSIYDSVSDTPFEGYIEIEDNRIKAIVKGKTRQYDDASQYRLIDCQDKTITAGLIDSHVHLFMGALYAATVDIYDGDTEEESAEILYDYYKDRSDPWVIGFRWSNYRWQGCKTPSKESLDKFFPDRPVAAFNNELHAVWVNSKALEICGINKDTPDPCGGLIERDKNGEPTGYLLEPSAMELITKHAFDISPQREEELLKIFMKTAQSKGITSVGAVHVLRIMKHEACRKLEDKGELRMRVFFAPHIEMEMAEALKLKDKYASDKLKFIGLKGFVDGTPLAYTGYMVEPYADRPDFRSEPMLDYDWLLEKSRECYRNDIPIRLHACGDGAVRMALDAYEAARKEYGDKDIRNTIEHIEVIHKDDIGRFARTNTVASIQPAHIVIDSLDIHPAFMMLDPDRIRLSWMGKTLAKNGAVVAFGTDYPIVDIDPVDNIYRAVKRRMADDLPEDGWNPQEKFTLAEAIKNYTINAAYMMNMEDKLGSLETGKLADVNVFDRDIFADDEALRTAKTNMTVFDGEIVYNEL